MKKEIKKKMKTYILKRAVYNDIDFPIGTIVKINDPKWEFEVVEGKLKGEKGHIADGVKGYIVDDTKENRTLIKRCFEQEKTLLKQLKQNTKQIEKIPNAVL